MLAGIGGVAVLALAVRRDGKEISAETVGAKLTEWLIKAGIGAAKSVPRVTVQAIDETGKAIIDEVVPQSECLKSMRAGDTTGVMWNCTPGDAIAWMNAGRPTFCNASGDGRQIYCGQNPAAKPKPKPAKKKTGAAIDGGAGDLSGVSFADLSGAWYESGGLIYAAESDESAGVLSGARQVTAVAGLRG